MDSTAWNQRYEGSELVWSATPNVFVQQLTEGLPAGTALDIAAGEGRNALWLAARGWQVTAVDFSAVALQRADSLAQKQLGSDAGRLVTLEADLETWVPQEHSYDLVLVVYLQVPEKQRSAVMRRAAEAVAPGGTLLVVGHDLANLASGHGGPQDPTVLYRPGDIVADIQPARLVIVRDETVTRSLTDDQGQPAEALDALVLARRAMG
ncbi:MAG TPA: class I SAM-dependent methyltransferase [Dermatophilaceae bacterium]|nr:class I SAM-dependent methyltransferase [Dermatophilaceae bacterium]